METKEQYDWSYATITSLNKLFDYLKIDQKDRIGLRLQFAKDMGETLGSLKMAEINKALKEIN